MSEPIQSRSRLTRFLPLAFIAAAAAAFFGLGLHHYLTIDALQARSAELDAFIAANRLTALALYFVIIVAVVACCLPGALVLGIAGAFLFGPLVSTPICLVASTLGCIVFFLAARTSLGAMLRARTGTWLDRLEQGIRANAFSYIFLIRLAVPIPLFATNIAAALFEVRFRDFALGTFLGLIGPMIVYGVIGDGLRAAFRAGAEADAGAAMRALMTSPPILAAIIGLVLLGLAPILVRRLTSARAT